MIVFVLHVKYYFFWGGAMWKTSVEEILEESVSLISHDIKQSTIEIFQRAMELTY